VSRPTDLGAGLRDILDAERELMPRDVYEVGSMLSYDERLLLHWAARTAAPGAIVDLGSFLGGSTLALASGAEHRGGNVDAFDLFVCQGDWERHWAPAGFELALGDSTRPAFEHNIARVRDRVAVHEGDVRRQRWQAPISVLFIDVTKSWATADAVWRTFLPRLQPGALVIQQDLVHWGHPWCAVVMEHLSEHFEYLGWVWFSSAVYRCRQPPRAVPVPMLERLTGDEMLRLIDQAAERVGEPGSGGIRLSAARVFAAFGRFDHARARVAEIRSSYDDSVLPHIEQGLTNLERWVEEAEARRTSPVLRDSEVRPNKPSISRHSTRLKVAVQDWRDRSQVFAQALFRGGHRAARRDDADVLLIDMDAPTFADRFEPPVFSYRLVIDHYKSIGAKVVMYPHGVGPALYYDGLFEPYEQVDLRLVPAVGYAEFLRRVECPGKVHVIGWSFCELAPFMPRREVRRVLFAPIHPSGTGDTLLEAHHREANVRIYERLLAAPWQLTVRIVGTPEENGLWRADGVKFVPGGMDLGLGDIHAADTVVAGAGTFPALAVARGVPTVMYRHGAPIVYGVPGGEPLPVLRADRYADYIRYPFDADDGPLDEVVQAAARSEDPIITWKRRFIGDRFDEAATAAVVEQTVWDAPRQPTLDSRRFAVVAFADELLERPELLARYAGCMSPEDDASLVLWGPGLDEGALRGMAWDAARAAGLDERRLPHLVALAHADIFEADRFLAERADALLSEWPPIGRIAELPRYGAADTEGLRAMGTASSSSTSAQAP
jgi:Methyltransferase domain